MKKATPYVGVTVRIEFDTHDALRTIAFNERRSIQSILDQALKEWLAKRDEKGNK
jgi:hypothetical protein